jgi:hypothetical protein
LVANIINKKLGKNIIYQKRNKKNIFIIIGKNKHVGYRLVRRSLQVSFGIYSNSISINLYFIWIKIIFIEVLNRIRFLVSRNNNRGLKFIIAVIITIRIFLSSIKHLG